MHPSLINSAAGCSPEVDEDTHILLRLQHDGPRTDAGITQCVLRTKRPERTIRWCVGRVVQPFSPSDAYGRGRARALEDRDCRKAKRETSGITPESSAHRARSSNHCRTQTNSQSSSFRPLFITYDPLRRPSDIRINFDRRRPRAEEIDYGTTTPTTATMEMITLVY